MLLLACCSWKKRARFGGEERDSPTPKGNEEAKPREEKHSAILVEWVQYWNGSRLFIDGVDCGSTPQTREGDHIDNLVGIWRSCRMMGEWILETRTRFDNDSVMVLLYGICLSSWLLSLSQHCTV